MLVLRAVVEVEMDADGKCSRASATLEGTRGKRRH
jgi:hypothetical protein